MPAPARFEGDRRPAAGSRAGRPSSSAASTTRATATTRSGTACRAASAYFHFGMVSPCAWPPRRSASAARAPRSTWTSCSSGARWPGTSATTCATWTPSRWRCWAVRRDPARARRRGRPCTVGHPRPRGHRRRALGRHADRARQGELHNNRMTWGKALLGDCRPGSTSALLDLNHRYARRPRPLLLRRIPCASASSTVPSRPRAIRGSVRERTTRHGTPSAWTKALREARDPSGDRLPLRVAVGGIAASRPRALRRQYEVHRQGARRGRRLAGGAPTPSPSTTAPSTAGAMRARRRGGAPRASSRPTRAASRPSRPGAPMPRRAPGTSASSACRG